MAVSISAAVSLLVSSCWEAINLILYIFIYLIFVSIICNKYKSNVQKCAVAVFVVGCLQRSRKWNHSHRHLLSPAGRMKFACCLLNSLLFNQTASADLFPTVIKQSLCKTLTGFLPFMQPVCLHCQSVNRYICWWSVLQKKKDYIFKSSTCGLQWTFQSIMVQKWTIRRQISVYMIALSLFEATL